MLNFRRWRASELLWSWCAYWLVLGVVSLGPPLLAAWRVTRPGTGRGNIAASLGDGVFHLTVTQTAPAAQTLWNGSIPLLPALLWVAVPPLLLWAGWLASRPKRGINVDAEGERVR